MKYLQETTKDWKCDFTVPNHIYLVEGMRCLGYIKEGTKEVLMFNKPLMFDKKKRSFKELGKRAIAEYMTQS